MSRFALVMLLLALPGASTSPAETPASPKTTLLAIATAMEDGDEPRLRTLMHSQSAAEQVLLEATVSLAGATRRLRAAAVSTFGEENAKAVVGDLSPSDRAA